MRTSILHHFVSPLLGGIALIALLAGAAPGGGRAAAAGPLPGVHAAPATRDAPPPPAGGVAPHVADGYGRLPLQFEPNRGQTDRRVRFLSRGPGYTLFLTGDEAVLSLGNAECGTHRPRHRNTQHAAGNTQHVIRMRIEGGSASAACAGLDPLPGKVNYLVGNNPRKWRAGIPTYARVRCRGVYPGIDLVYYGSQGRGGGGRPMLEYDFVVAPGADPGRIRLSFAGTDDLRVSAAGDLVLRAGTAGVCFRKPRVYQEIAGRRREVAAAWVVGGPREGRSARCGVAETGRPALDAHPIAGGPQGAAGRAPAIEDRKTRIENPTSACFRLGAYDRSRPLVIDPVLAYSTYLGGTNNDYILAMAVDAAKCLTVAGATGSLAFPATSGAYQATHHGDMEAFVTKLNAAGTAVLYSTFLGGAGRDEAMGLALDSAGNAFLAGSTNSADFPTTAGAFRETPAGLTDTFVAALNPTGSGLVYSTLVGGADDDFVGGLALDAAGSVFLTGFTRSDDLPATTGAFSTSRAGSEDAYVAQVAPGGASLGYCTYLGGTGQDVGCAIALDSVGVAHVTGRTWSSDFPSTPDTMQPVYGGSKDCFVAAVLPGGTALLYATFLGGLAADEGLAILSDSDGNVTVGGETYSTNFPATPDVVGTTKHGGADGFVTRINANGLPVFSTYLGGSGWDRVAGLAEGRGASLWVALKTGSPDFPTTPGALQTSLAGETAAALTLLRPLAFGVDYSTLLGGSSRDESDCIVLDRAGDVYVAGLTRSSDFPTTSGAFQRTLGGALDSFVAKIIADGPPLLAAIPNQAGSVGDTVGLALSASDPEGGFLTFSATGLPPGLAIDPATGRITGTLTTDGIYAATAIVNDNTFGGSRGDTARRSFQWKVIRTGATGLAIRAQPLGAHAGEAFFIGVYAEYAGVLDTGFTGNVTLGISSGPAGGVLGGTTTVAAVAGRAEFANLTVNRLGTYVLRATSGVLTTALSEPIRVTPGPPAALVFKARPGSTAAGVSLFPTPVVMVVDAAGFQVTTATNPITVALGTNPTGTVLKGTLTRTAAAGQATFTGLNLDRASDQPYTLVAKAEGLPPATSAGFLITAGPAHHVAFLTQPRATRYGAPVTPAVRLGVQDRFNNACTRATNAVALALGANPTGGVLSGTRTKAAVSGSASFGDLSINKAGAGYTLRATASGLVGATSTAFDITAGAPAGLAFTMQPASRPAGEAILVKVALVDAAGNVCTTARNSISLGIATNPAGGVLSGTRVVAAVAGVAVFPNLSINKASGSAYTLKASCSVAPDATSRGFLITAAAPKKLAFTVQPRSTRAGSVITPAVRVTILDAFGNTCTRATNTLAVALATNPTGALLVGTRSKAASGGSASFADLKVSKPGTGYTLRATATGLASATSAAFNGL